MTLFLSAYTFFTKHNKTTELQFFCPICLLSNNRPVLWVTLMDVVLDVWTTSKLISIAGRSDHLNILPSPIIVFKQKVKNVAFGITAWVWIWASLPWESKFPLLSSQSLIIE